MSERFLFIHGGPGFNSFPERAILAPVVEAAGHRIAFWDEPSRFRPRGDPFEAEGAFAHWLDSAERFVLQSGSEPAHLIAHCSGAQAALEIARRHPKRLSRVTLVAPSVDGFAAYRNVLRLAYEDFTEGAAEEAPALAVALKRTRRLFDEPMREGLQLAARDERLLTHYFADANQLQAAAVAMGSPEAQFDGESFFAVLSDFAARSDQLLSTRQVTVPVLAIFGSVDLVSPMEEQLPPLRAAAEHLRTERLDRAGHYLHLDRPERFLTLMLDAVP